MPQFTTTIPVRFEHVDPAGIAFYPRYFIMFNQTIEEWFERELQLSFAELHEDPPRGIPTVDIHAQFHNPSKLGDQLQFALVVERLGGASFAVRIEASCDGEPRITCHQKLVYTEKRDGKHGSAPIPGALRQASRACRR